MAGRSRRGRFSRRAAFRSPIVSGSAWAEVAAHFTTEDPRVVEALSPFHVWTADYATSERRGSRATRCTCSSCVHRIPRPVTVRVRDEYHGCRSWVEIDREPPFEGTPVMADEEFARAAGSIGMIAGQPEPVPA